MHCVGPRTGIAPAEEGEAAAAVRGLLAALEAQGTLGKQAPVDASDESLEYLLRSAASLAATGPLPPPAAGAAAEPLQVQRIRSGFKAFWADELQEGEGEDDDEDEDDEGETE